MGIERGATSGSVNKMEKKPWRKQKPKSANYKSNDSNDSRTKTSGQTCRNCGGSWPHKGGRESCPAKDRKCYKCSKLGHYAKLCRKSDKSQVNQTTKEAEDDSSDTAYVGGWVGNAFIGKDCFDSGPEPMEII